MTTGQHAVVLFSGGLDSTTLLYDIARKTKTVQALTISYGQRHRREMDAAADIVNMLDNVDWSIIHINGIADLLTSSVLTNHTEDIPEGHYAESNMSKTVVPNRNAMMLSIAYSVGVSQGADMVTFAAHAGDHPIYPDCRPEFVNELAGAFMSGNAGLVEPLPLMAGAFVTWTKADIVWHGMGLGVPFEKTWSCYKGGEKHCGRCGTCVERAEAFHLAAVADPTDYEDPEYWREAVFGVQGSHNG